MTPRNGWHGDDPRMAGMKCQEMLARAVARTKGQESAAAKALAEFELRRGHGEDVIIFPFRGKWLVGSADELVRHSDEHRRPAPEPALASRRTIDAARPHASGESRRPTVDKKKRVPE